MVTQGDDESASGWLVVVSAFFIRFLTDGLAFVFGVLLIELTDEFQESIAVIAFIGSLTNSVMFLSGPLVGLLSGVLNSRTIVILGAVISFSGFLGATFSKSIAALSMTYGLLTGFGFCMMYLPANSKVVQIFEKRRALAIGISACGSGVGTFINSLLVRYLIDHYTWRGATFVLSGIVLHGIPFGLLLTSTNYNNDPKPQSTKPGTPENDRKHVLRDLKNTALEHLQLLKDIRCISVLVSTFLVDLAYSVPSMLLPDQAVNIGMTKAQATWLVSSIGLASIFGRTFCGWVADYNCVNKTVLFESSLVLAGLCTVASPFLESFETKLLYSCLFGFLIGGYIVLVPVVLTDMFGPDLIDKSYGLNMLAVGIPCLFAAPFGGWLFEVTGSFHVTFVVAGIELALGGLALLLPVCCKRLSILVEQQSRPTTLI